VWNPDDMSRIIRSAPRRPEGFGPGYARPNSRQILATSS